MIVDLVLLFFFVVLALILKRNFDSRKHLPPGPIRWPILGSVPQMLMIDLSYPHKQFTGLTEKYGGIFSLGFGVRYAVVVSKFEIMKDMMRRPETVERARFEFFQQRCDQKNLGLVWSYGDVWKEQSKLSLKLLRQFGFGKKHTMDETLQAEVDELVVEIKKEIEASDGIWEVDDQRLAAFQLNVLWASVGGYRFDPHSEEIRHLLQISEEIFESLGPKNLLTAFPFLKIFPNLSGYKRHYEIHKNSKDFILELLEDAKQKREGRTEPESFVEAYLDEIDKNKSNANSKEQLVLILMDLFLAGSDNTSAALYWVILYLGLYKNVQHKVREEITKYTKEVSIPIPATALSSMPYTNAIILEVMRHCPFVPTTLPRLVLKGTTCEGYKISSGTILFANFLAVCHDKEFWGDPDVFRPERMLLANGALDTNKTERVVHFGFGPRKCPGENMAISSLFIATTTLIRTFSLGVVKGREPSLDPEKPSLTLKPCHYALHVKML